MAAIARLTGAPSANCNNWKAINWQKVRREVRRLQIRIAKAVMEGRYGRVKALQWLLTRSFSGKALAVKRVVSNRGRKTPGVDGAIWYTPKQRMQAVRNLKRHGYLFHCGEYIYRRRTVRRALSVSPPCMTE